MDTQMAKVDRRKMEMSSILTYTGAGLGLGLYAVFGVLKSSFIGGIIGINLAGVIMGLPLESNVLSRVIVALGMLLGIMVAGLIFVSAGASLGWAIGKVADSAREVSRKRHIKGAVKASNK